MLRRMNRSQLAALVACDLPRHAVVNLGIGMPTLVTDYLAPDAGVTLHSENGILGMRLLQAGEPTDGDLINASKQFVALLDGAAIVDHACSFAIMRGGHVDISVLGAFEVASNGDLANWSLGEDDPLPSVGGAMDLAVGAREVWVMMQTHTADGRPRLVSACSLPLTGSGVVDRVYTPIGVFEVRDGCFIPRRLLPGLKESDLQDWIAAPVRAHGPIETISVEFLHPCSGATT